MKRMLLSLVFYTLGIIGIFLSDLMINHYFSVIEIKTWVQTKSLMMMVGPFLLLGYNSVYLRYPEKLKSTFRLTIKFILIWSVLAIIIKNIINTNLILMLPIGFAFSLMTTSLLRVSNGNLLAQINQSIWKILLFILVAYLSLSGISIKYFYEILFIFLVAPSLLFLLKVPFDQYDNNQPLNSENRDFAIQMLFSAIFLNIAVYLELFILSTFYEAEIVALYFIYFTIFTAYGIFVSGYLGFYLTPKIRKSPDIVLSFIQERKNLIFILISLMGLVNALIGMIYLYTTSKDIDVYLILLFTLLGMLRILYIFPTSKMGALAQPKDLHKFLKSNIVLTFLYIAILAFVVYIKADIYIIVIVVIINWLLRVCIANLVANSMVIK